MDDRLRLASASRDSLLALRRVERQQALIERLYAARGERLRLGVLADEQGVSIRTVARDVERLRLSGVPLVVHRGPDGGVSFPSSHAPLPLVLDAAEVAALMSSLAVVGPTVSVSAASAMRKLSASFAPGGTDAGPGSGH